jgi:hypothetical protein
MTLGLSMANLLPFASILLARKSYKYASLSLINRIQCINFITG